MGFGLSGNGLDRGRPRGRLSWRGIVALITAAGVALTPEQQAAIVSAGLAVIGLIGVLLGDQKKQ